MAVLNFKHLRYFWMVAKTGSIARASDQLCLTPQSISGQLSEFEDRLGVALFRRAGRNRELSDAGRRILSHAEQIFALGDEIIDLLNDQKAKETLPFRVGIADSVSKSVAYRLVEPALTNGDPVRLVCREGRLQALLAELAINRLDMIFADPPYFLSNGGITCHAGKMVKVDKGQWDKSNGPELNHEFNMSWLSRCQRLLKPNGTIWVSGTHHVIHSVGYAMQQLGMKILNDITWEKPNPPPNLSCRYFTHSTETIIWAARNEKAKHCFNYDAMRKINDGKQMKSVWTLPSPNGNEKVFGKHPTQKPIALLERIILASTNEGDLVMDPFSGSSTTGVAAIRLKRRFVGIELESEYLSLSVKRLEQEINARKSSLNFV